MPKKNKKQVRSTAIKSKNDTQDVSSFGGDFPGLPPPATGQQGLVNLGNTCYLNSVLQCLSVSKPFSDNLVTLSQEGLGGVGASLCSVFQGLRGNGNQGKAKGGGNGAFSPKQLLAQICSKFPWYKGHDQQDCHELLRTLLGSVADEPTATEKKHKKEGGAHIPCGEAEKLVWQSFRGHTCAAVLCWKCQRISVRVDPFLDLSVELPTCEEQPGLLGLPGRIAQLEVGGSSSSTARPTKSKGRKGGTPADADNAADADVDPQSEAVQPAVTSQAQGTPFYMRPSVATWFQPLRQPASQVSRSPGMERSLDKESEQDAEPGVDEKEEEETSKAEPESFVFEVELRKRGKKDPRWGFGWCNESLQQKRLRVASVNPETVLDRWNLKKKSMGEEELAVREGDEVIAVGGEAVFVTMQQLLREEVVKLTLRRESSSASACPGKISGTAATESDADDQEAAESSARSYLQAAHECHASLAEDLQAVFSDPVAIKVNGSCQLQDCLFRFTSSEAVEEDAKPVYQCSECAKAQRGSDTEKKALPRSFASRRVWLCQPLPPLLTVHMKRFRRSGAKFEKNGKHVTLPPVLDLSDYLLTEETCGRLRPHLASDCKELICKSEGGSRFEIYGICVHKGGSLQSGHYIAFINVGPSLAEEKWYGASDTHVWSCPRSDVLEAEAYVAFYRKMEEPNASEEAEGSVQADLDGELPPEGSSDQEDPDA